MVVNLNDLDEEYDVFYYKGQLFTGVGIELNNKGDMIWECGFVDGKKNGVERSFHQNGSVAEEIQWKLNHVHGYERKWDSNGRLKKERFRRFSETFWEKEYDNSGELLRHSIIDPESFAYRMYLKRKEDLKDW